MSCRVRDVEAGSMVWDAGGERPDRARPTQPLTPAKKRRSPTVRKRFRSHAA
jgi:hypothetical protein